MAKFYGEIGYGEAVDAGNGVWKEQIVEYIARGDVIRNTRRLSESQQSVNDDISVSNSISIVMDAYSREHFFAIRYVKWQGALWKVTDVEVQSPRLLLRLGGVYNGPRPAPVSP